MKKPVILLFRQDLRLADNPALTEAAKREAPIIPLYVLDEETAGKWKAGGASRWWLHSSLEALQKALNRRKTPLILKKREMNRAVLELVKKVKAEAVFWNRCYEPYATKQESALKKELKRLGVEAESFKGALLLEPWEVVNNQGSFYKVFTPFWRACLEMIADERPLPVPRLTASDHLNLKSDRLDRWALLPAGTDWAGGLREMWTPGEEGAKKRLEQFLKKKMEKYSRLRDFPAEEGTSLLSPHLHFGEISPRQIFHAAKGAESFIAEIGWREFSHHLLYHFPTLPERPFAEKFRSFPWNRSEKQLKAWQQGKSGYPIVDAGMRQLWHCGWMHNRVRMVAASFLTKHLGISWVKGEEWFWDTLVDADLASNAANWQWVAGCGADAAPYIRVFNPILQGKKFDPEGRYIREWIPELREVPEKFLHTPWEASGHSYPPPIVDHQTARKEALERFKR